MRFAGWIMVGMLLPRPLFAQAVGTTAAGTSFVVAGLTRAVSEPPEVLPAQTPLARRRNEAELWALGTTVGGYLAVGLASAEGSKLGPVANPIGLAGGVAIFLGPSAGHMYAGEGGHAVGMTALRLGSVVVGGIGLILSLYESCSYSASGGPATGGDGCTRPDAAVLGVPLFLLGAAGFVGGTVYDLVDAPRAVTRVQEGEVVLAAVLRRDPDGTPLPGVALAFRF